MLVFWTSFQAIATEHSFPQPIVGNLVTMIELSTICIVLVIAIPLAARFCKRHGIPDKIFHSLVLIHITTTALYVHMPGDWQGYYDRGSYLVKTNSSFEYLRYGTRFIDAISHLIQSILDVGPLGMTAIFSSFGFFGILFVAASVRRWLVPNRFDIRYFLLLPGLHVWTSALGKDSLIFFAISFLLLSVSQKKILTTQNGFALFLIFMIRPHVAMMLIVSACMANFICRDGISSTLRTLTTVVSLTAIALLLPVVMNFMGISEENPLESVSNSIQFAAEHNQTGGGAVDITGYSPPVRLFTYLFRPLFFDIRNLMGWPASIENAILLASCGLAICHGLPRFLLAARFFEIWFAVFFVSLMWFVNGMSTANLGIALRQKTQFLPFLYYLLVVFRFSKIKGIGKTRMLLSGVFKKQVKKSPKDYQRSMRPVQLERPD